MAHGAGAGPLAAHPPGLLVGVADVRLDVGAVHKGQVDGLGDVAARQVGCDPGQAIVGGWVGHAMTDAGKPVLKLQWPACLEWLLGLATIKHTWPSLRGPVPRSVDPACQPSCPHLVVSTITLGEALSWSRRVSSELTARMASAGSDPPTAPFLQRRSAVRSRWACQ